MTLPGQGHRSGDETVRTHSGPIPGPGTGQLSGRASARNEVKQVKLKNLRRVQDASDPKKVKIIFDGLGEGAYQIYIEKIGEDGISTPATLISPDGQVGDSVTAALTSAARQALVLESAESLAEYALTAKYIPNEDEGNES